MKRQVVWIAAVGFAAALAFATSAMADLTPEQKQAAEALIRQFSAKEYEVREAAVKGLIELGPDVVPLVKKARDEAADAEVKLRCEMVLDGIKAKPATQEQKPASKVLLESSKVTLDVKDASLADLLRKLSEQSGNAPISVPRDWEEKPITLSVKDVPYWQALDRVCKLAELTYNANALLSFATAKAAAKTSPLTLTPAPKANEVSAYVGPVVFKADDRANNVMRQGNGLSHQLSYFWEDRLPVTSATVTVTKVLGPDNRELKLQDAGGGLMPQRIFVGGSSAARVCSGTLWVNLVDVPEKLDKLAEVSGKIRLDFGTGEKEIKVEDVFGANKAGGAGGLSVLVTQASKDKDSASLKVKLARDGKPESLPYGTSPNFGFRLVAPDGKRCEGTTLPGNVTARVFAGGDGNAKVAVGVTIVVAGGADATGGELSLQFNDLPEQEGPWSLVYVFPSEIVTKEYPFTLTNVPLP